MYDNPGVVYDSPVVVYDSPGVVYDSPGVVYGREVRAVQQVAHIGLHADATLVTCLLLGHLRSRVKTA